MIKISNICLHQNSIVIKFFKILKIREIFCEDPRIIFVLFYDVHKKNMFTINLEDGREAPYKASIKYILVNLAAEAEMKRSQNVDLSNTQPKVMNFNNFVNSVLVFRAHLIVKNVLKNVVGFLIIIINLKRLQAH